MIVCVWNEGGKWFWDDSEDHGGFDRISPMGPFETERAAREDARAFSPTCSFEGGKPLHYLAEEMFSRDKGEG